MRFLWAWLLAKAAAAQAVDEDGGDDDDTDQRVLPVGIHARQYEAVADHLDQRRADDGAQRPADAASQIGAADDRGGDDAQLIAIREIGRHRAEPAAEQDTGDGGR